MQENPRPPRIATSFLEWFCPEQLLESIEGDLAEQFEDDIRSHHVRIAKLKYIWNVLRFFRLDIILRNKFTISLLNTMMLSNYFLIARRSIAKRKLYSFINAFGLSIGIAFSILIYLFIEDEKSFDQFHAKKDVIYRIHNTTFNPDAYKKGEANVYRSHAYLPAKFGEVMLDELAEVAHMTRYVEGTTGTFRYKDKIFEEKATMVDSGFFKMFSFEILSGNAHTIFKNPTDAVITSELAKKYFGDEDPIGKTFTFEIKEETTFTIVAVIDNPPTNSSLAFSLLLPMEAQPWFKINRDQWGSQSYPTFVELKPNTDNYLFKSHLDTLTSKYMGDRMKRFREREHVPKEYKITEFNIIPLTGIHLASEVSWHKVSDKKYSWILGGIALLITVIACINYISLALTTSTSRRVEVGIRKVVGAQRSQLVSQFAFESIVLAFISMLIGIFLAILFLPSFNQFTNKTITLSTFSVTKLVGVSFLLTCLVGLIAGSYPSFVLSGFIPTRVLKGGFTTKLQAGFTKPLVVFQFFLSASLIICSVIMYQQMQFITTKELGYAKEQLIKISTQAWDRESNQRIQQVRNTLAANPNIVGVTGTSASFNNGWSHYGYRIKDETKYAYVYSVDPNYIPLLNIELLQGRNFDERIPSDTNAIVVNEALVRDMGWTDPLNEHLNFYEDTVGSGAKVIGVVKDYHFLSLEKNIEPMFLSMDHERIGHLSDMLIKVTPDDIPQSVSDIKSVWTKLFPDEPFEYTFVDEDVSKQYESYQRWMKVTGLSTGFAIVIACLGLFGLSGINALNRAKEISIRKVMGAELRSIFMLLNTQYIVFAIIAFLLAAPASWFVMNKWLDSFQFRITIGWELFAVSMAIGLLIALATVSYHALKVANVNPAQTLKSE